MKSITIHGMDDTLERLIRARAEAEGLSLNKTIKRLLQEALGVVPSPTQRHGEDFAEFLGTWTTEQKRAFEEATSDLRGVDPAEWP